MLKRTVLLGAIAILALSGCEAIKERRLPTIAEIQGAAVTTCSFIPTASTASELLQAAIPELKTATDFAKAICEAVQAKASTVGQPPKVGKVVIEGRRV